MRVDADRPMFGLVEELWDGQTVGWTDLRGVGRERFKDARPLGDSASMSGA